MRFKPDIISNPKLPDPKLAAAGLAFLALMPLARPAFGQIKDVRPSNRSKSSPARIWIDNPGSKDTDFSIDVGCLAPEAITFARKGDLSIGYPASAVLRGSEGPNGLTDYELILTKNVSDTARFSYPSDLQVGLFSSTDRVGSFLFLAIRSKSGVGFTLGDFTADILYLFPYVSGKGVVVDIVGIDDKYKSSSHCGLPPGRIFDKE